MFFPPPSISAQNYMLSRVLTLSFAGLLSGDIESFIAVHIVNTYSKKGL